MWVHSGYKWEVQWRDTETGLWKLSLALFTAPFECKEVKKKFLFFKWKELQVIRDESWKVDLKVAVNKARESFEYLKDVKLIQFRELVWTGGDDGFMKQGERVYDQGETIWKNGEFSD